MFKFKTRITNFVCFIMSTQQEERDYNLTIYPGHVKILLSKVDVSKRF